jgi:hypothetical protein
MGLDIKIPIGAMFTLLGLLLAIFGLVTSGDAALYERSMDININLWTGISMLIIGVLMLATSRFKSIKEE